MCGRMLTITVALSSLSLSCSRSEQGELNEAVQLPQVNCASTSPTDGQRFALHDLLGAEYTGVLEAGTPRAGYDHYVYVFGAHWQEHTANGFESYLDNYTSNDLDPEVAQYRALLVAMG
ncbi:MAG: hypothetical protein ACR2QM_04725, partial [Longimicrobiales bacterium]